MNDSHWRSAAHMAMQGMQMNPLEQYIPDQPAPTSRYRCFSSGDIEIDRVGEEYDFVLTKRPRTERGSSFVLGPGYVVEAPLLRMITSPDAVSCAQMQTLRYLQQIQRTSSLEGGLGDANGYGVALERIAADAKVGVRPSLAIQNELIRIAVEEGRFAAAFAVAEEVVQLGAVRGGRPRVSSFMRLVEALSEPLRNEVSTTSFAGRSQPLSPLCGSLLIHSPEVIAALGVGVGDTGRVIGPVVRDVDRIIVAAKGLARIDLHTLALSDVSNDRLMSIATDVYAALLVQIYRSQDGELSEADAGLDVIAHGFFMGAFGVAHLGSSANGAKHVNGVSFSGSRWLATTILQPARQLRAFIRARRPMAVSEELLYALLCMLSCLGLSGRAPHYGDYNSIGNNGDSTASGEGDAGAIAAMREVVAVLDGIVNDAASSCESPVLQATMELFCSHLQANLQQLMELCRYKGVGEPKSAASDAAAVSLFPNLPSSQISEEALPAALWASIANVCFSRIPLNTAVHIMCTERILPLAALLAPYLSKGISLEAGGCGLYHEALGVLVIVLAAVFGDAAALGDTISLFGEGIRVGASALILQQSLPLCGKALDWYARVTGESLPSSVSDGIIVVAGGWLRKMSHSSGGVIVATKDLVALCDYALRSNASLITSLCIDIVLECAGNPMFRSTLNGEGFSKVFGRLYALIAASGCDTSTLDALSKSQEHVARLGFAVAANPQCGAAKLLGPAELEIVLRSSTLPIDVAPGMGADAVVVQALVPRDTSPLTLSVAPPNPSSFYVMVVDHTALDVLSQTNAILPPSSLTMSTEVNAFASLMTKYTAAGGVLLCVPPTALAACSPHSLKMLANWWRTRAPWLALFPQAALAVSNGDGLAMAGLSFLANEEMPIERRADIAWVTALGVMMKRGGCLKTAIVTASPQLHMGVLKEHVSPEADRPASINIVELLGKLVRK